MLSKNVVSVLTKVAPKKSPKKLLSRIAYRAGYYSASTGNQQVDYGHYEDEPNGLVTRESLSAGKHIIDDIGVSIDEFPGLQSLPEKPTIWRDIDARQLSRAIMAVCSAVDTDSIRYALKAIAIFPGAACACDGNRLYWYVLDTHDENGSSADPILIPAQYAQELARTMADCPHNYDVSLVRGDEKTFVNIPIGPGYLRFTDADSYGRYPKVSDVLKGAMENEYLDASYSAKWVAGLPKLLKSELIKPQPKIDEKALKIEADTVSYGKLSAPNFIPAILAGLHLDIYFLIDAFEKLGKAGIDANDSVRIRNCGPEKPVLLESGPLTILIMPISKD